MCWIVDSLPSKHEILLSNPPVFLHSLMAIERIATQFPIKSIKSYEFIQVIQVILLMEEILHQLRLVVYPIIYKVLYIPGGF